MSEGSQRERELQKKRKEAKGLQSEEETQGKAYGSEDVVPTSLKACC